MVPVKSPNRTQAKSFTSSYLVDELVRGGEHDVEFSLPVCQLFWSRAEVVHVSIEWNGKSLLLFADHRVAGCSTKDFQYEQGTAYDRQKVQMGLRKGNTVLVHFRRGDVSYQAVLIMISADFTRQRPPQNQHKYWKYVSPHRTYFAWLPATLAQAFCGNAPGFPDPTTNPSFLGGRVIPSLNSF